MLHGLAEAEQSAALNGQVASDMPLNQVYSHYFYHKIADTEAERELAYRLRYRVYCEETGYLSKEGNPGGIERDEHDDHSVQCLLYHRLTNAAVGTMRVVLPRPELAGCGQPARLCSPALDMLPESELPRACTGEISRFCIIPEFRKRRDDGMYPSLYDTGGVDPRRVVPHMTLGLMTALFEVALVHGITHLCAVIDPALLRMLSKLGLRFVSVGDPIEFHGQRQPVYVDGNMLMASQAVTHPEIHDVVSAGGVLQPLNSH